MKLNIEELNNINLANLEKYAQGTSDVPLSAPAGKSHYRLLTHISHNFNNLKIIDIGTHYGWSALCLGSNNKNKVVTYDLQNLLKTISPNILEIKNIKFKHTNFLDDIHELEDTKLIFLDIDPHDGLQEKKIYESLIQNGFKGILIVDDILLNQGMRRFWDTIYHDKEDITNFGHYTGTGIVYFNR